MRRWSVSLAAGSHQRSRGPGSGGGSLCPARAEQDWGSQGLQGGAATFELLGGPCFPPFICHFLWIQAHLYRGWVLRVVLGHNVQVTLHNDHD